MVDQADQWEHRMAAVNGINIHYVIEGQGAPVVFIHGWPEFWYGWRRQIPVLSERYQVIVPDLRGFGYSDKPLHGYDTKSAASDIYELVQQLGHQQVSIVAHDIGVRVAYRFALDHEETVSRMVLLDHLAKGRVILGVGPGALTSDAVMLGIDPARQREMMDESLNIIMRLFTETEPITYKSDWFEMNEAMLQLRPYQQPHLPVAVASAQSPAGPRLAGRHGASILSLSLPSGTVPRTSLQELWSIGGERQDHAEGRLASGHSRSLGRKPSRGHRRHQAWRSAVNLRILRPDIGQ